MHTLYINAKTPPQKVDSRVRTTIYGYPCCVFWKADDNATPMFISKGNYNYDKGSEEAFGFTSDYPDAFSVEFCNNTSDPCLFHGEISDAWGDDFEFRYPDGYEDISDFKRMHSWVVSTWQGGATNAFLAGTYTGVDGDTYTQDTAAYRLAKFKKEFTDYFDMNFALVYYVYAVWGLYVDSLAKNLFLTTFDRKHWYCYFYDMDTCLGINNEGVLNFDYYHLDIDKIGNAYVFNGQSSALWENFRQAFPDEIRETYRTWRSNGLMTYDRVLEYFITNQVSRYSASIYNEDAEYKYIEMLRTDNDATNLFQVRGSAESHLRYFAKNRLNYFDSYLNAGTYPDDYASLRIYTPTGDLTVEPNANITITPYSHSFVGVKYKANGTLMQQRAEAGSATTFIAPNEKFNDTETAIYPASQISSLGDLSPLYCGTINLSKATKLTEIIVGNGTEGYSNTNLRDFAVGANKLLKKVDVQNCPNLTSALALSECPNIEEVYAQGSGITSVELPSSGYLKKIYLPATITNLTVTNQQYIEEFHLEGYYALTTLRIEKTINIPVEDIMLNAPNLNRIRLLDITWAAESEEALRQTIEKFKSCLGLDANGNNTDKAVVTGRVTVPSISDELYNDIYENFPDLVVDDGSGKPYILNYKDRDGTSLYLVRVAEGADAINPIEAGYISKPADIEGENYKYIFVGWSTLPTNIHRHYVITAQYNTLFAIKYYNGDKLLLTKYAVMGHAASDPVADGELEAPTRTGTDDLHYIFSDWDNLPTNVQATTSVYAQFTNVYPVRFYTDSDLATLYYTQWVVDGQDAFDPVASGDIVAPTKEGTNDKHYTFNAWNIIPTNVKEIIQVYALYIDTWAVRFHNDDTLVNTQWVLNRQSAVDPVATGLIATPTRTSTAQYHFTYIGWDGNYTNVTESRDIYAKYKNTIRTYNVYFYNGDTLLQTVENVQYGSSATYTGATPVKDGVDDPENYVFKRWNPSPNNITGETKCRAIFRYIGYLADDWATIESHIEDGTATSIYQIGARKEVPFSIDGVDYIADVEIIAHNHDDLADGSGKATLTFACKDLPEYKIRFNASNDNTGGWEASEARSICNGTLYDALPDELKAVIKPVFKLSDGGVDNKTLVQTVDKVWIASYEEVGLPTNRYVLEGQGKTYSMTFSDNESRKKYLEDGTTSGYITRSSYLNDNSKGMIMRVTASGGSYSDIAFNYFHAAFGFCM